MVAAIAPRKPVDSHCAVSWLMAKRRMIAGTATLMMVASTTIADVARMTVSVTSQR